MNNFLSLERQVNTFPEEIPERWEALCQTETDSALGSWRFGVHSLLASHPVPEAILHDKAAKCLNVAGSGCQLQPVRVVQ